LAERADSEHEQALLRIAIVGLFLAYMAGFHGWPSDWSPHDRRVVAILAAFLLTAIGIFAAICVSPQPHVVRRLTGMAADCAGCTWYMWVAGDYGFFVIGVYLFITFGNGFRYGLRYLFGCQALCLAGLISNLLFASYWHQRQVPGIGLLIALVVLPLYVSTLLKRIQEARARAEEANVAKTTFLANMSHEMRTPLNGIVGVVDLLRTTALSPVQVELVALLRHSISVLRSLVDDVLDITKIEAGHLTIEVTSFDLHASINGLMHLMRPHAEAKGLTLTAMIDPALEYRLRGDPHHLRQILLNLVGNAIKFTDRGSVQLSVSLLQETDTGVTARFEVTDTGIGIAPGAVERIFERFVQADESTTRKYGGTGLGTTIAKQLTELMGGCIGVTSKLGEGSTFWVELPLLKDAHKADSAVSISASAHAKREEELTLVLSAPGHGDVQSALRSIGEPFEFVTPTTLPAKFDALRKDGYSPRAIIAALPIEQACAAFTAILSRTAKLRPALIYIANGEISVIDRARVNSLDGAYALEHASPRLIQNAIHASLSGRGANDVRDIADVLQRARASLRVLVAEDNLTKQKMIRQLLESAGHEVLLASDGEQALDLYEAEDPDLGIFDFNMPRRSGIEVIQAIRAMERPGVRMPAVILSASVTPESRIRAQAAGADEFVGKPFDAASLLQRIDELVPTPRNARPRRPAPAKLRIAVDNNVSARATAGVTVYADDLIDAGRFAQLEDIASTTSFLSELIDGFASDVRDILEKTRTASRSGDRSSIPDLMHSLKGAAVGVGATRLASLASEFEASASMQSPEQMEKTVAGVGRCFDDSLSNLRQRVDALQAQT
jgi:two-component system sensor histidine kinase RpfC